MPKTEIFFLDRQDQRITDRVTGTPNVYATVAIGGLEVISAQPAIVDTGADFCVISECELSVFKDQVRPADKSTLEHPYLRDAQEDVYEGTITIHGLDELVQTYFTARPYRPRILMRGAVIEDSLMSSN
jgi:hypothetical protein